MCIRDSADPAESLLHTILNGVATEQAKDEFLNRLTPLGICLLYTSDAADERSSVDLGGRRIIKKKTMNQEVMRVLLTADKCTHRIVHKKDV